MSPLRVRVKDQGTLKKARPKEGPYHAMNPYMVLGDQMSLISRGPIPLCYESLYGYMNLKPF